jgi:cell division protein FtsB
MNSEQIQQLQDENMALKRELEKLRKENTRLESRNDFIIDLLTEDQLEELMEMDKEVSS